MTSRKRIGQGAISADVRLDSKLIDATDLQAFSQELRLSSNDVDARSAGWSARSTSRSTANTDRRCRRPGTTRVISRLSITTASTAPTSARRPTIPYFSDLTYDFEQFALFGEAHLPVHRRLEPHGGLRYYDFCEDRVLTFAGLFADQGYTDEPGSTESDGSRRARSSLSGRARTCCSPRRLRAASGWAASTTR